MNVKLGRCSALFSWKRRQVFEQLGRDDDPIASDLFNIHESDRETKPDVYVSKQHVFRASPNSLKILAGHFLDGIDYRSQIQIPLLSLLLKFINLKS